MWDRSAGDARGDQFVADPRSFQTDLDQLANAADVQVPDLIDLVRRQTTALEQFTGISQPTMVAGPDAAFFDLVGILRDRATRASQVLGATREALHDIAVCYMRADGRL
jgi:hypothetical protein